LWFLTIIRIYRRGRRGRIDLPGLILIAGVVSLSIIMLTRGQTTQESIYYYHTDHLGTPIMLTDANQQVAWDATYDPFGKADITTSTVTNNLRFPGQYYDAETGLHYNWHRYYWPEVGRYMGPDPWNVGTLHLPGAAERLNKNTEDLDEIFLITPHNQHLYTYSLNNPVIYADIDSLKIQPTTSSVESPNPDIIAKLECIQRCLGHVPIYMTSGRRSCVKGSHHCTGDAVDTGKWPGIPTEKVACCAKKCGFLRVAEDDNGTKHYHFDTGTESWNKDIIPKLCGCN